MYCIPILQTIDMHILYYYLYYKYEKKLSQEFSRNVLPIFRQSLLLGEFRRLLIESPNTKQNIKIIEDIEN